MSFKDGAQFPAPAHKLARIRTRIQLFPVRFQDWSSFATHTSSATLPEYFVYRDRSDDGGTKPLREALRFASIAPHNLPCRERFAGRFSEGVLAHVQRKTLFL